MNFVFYDTETTGLDTTFDQILQFAAILTDADLNELGRFETRSRLLPHVIPAPGALLATRVISRFFCFGLTFDRAEVTGIVAESVARQAKNELNTLNFKQLQRRYQMIDYQLGAVGQP
jgi:exonuclease I